MRMIRKLVCCLVLAVGVTACGSNGSTPPPPPPPPPAACPAGTICMTGRAFYTTPSSNPPGLSVGSGTPVAWRNSSGVVHNVTFADPAAAGSVGGGASGNIVEHSSGTNSRVFSAPGTQNFQCTIHLNMVGAVVVQ